MTEHDDDLDFFGDDVADDTPPLAPGERRRSASLVVGIPKSDRLLEAHYGGIFVRSTITFTDEDGHEYPGDPVQNAAAEAVRRASLIAEAVRLDAADAETAAAAKRAK